MHDQHMKLLQIHEIEIQKTLKERQNTYEEACQQEVDNYRRFGQVLSTLF